MDDHTLMGIYADTLFTYDTGGRMLLTNEPCAVARRPAPRLFLGCTPAGQVVRIGATVPDDLAYQLEEIIERHPPTASLHAPAAALSAVREALSQHAPLTQEESGPAYYFPPSITPPGEAIRLTEANVAVARQTYPWLLEELPDWGPCFAVMHNGTAVSVCFSSRIGTDAEAAGVETLLAFRGRGYAAAVTAAWGAAVRERGRTRSSSSNYASRRTSLISLSQPHVVMRVPLIAAGTCMVIEQREGPRLVVLARLGRLRVGLLLERDADPSRPHQSARDPRGSAQPR